MPGDNIEMAGVRGLVLCLILTSSISVTWQQHSLLEKLREVDIKGVMSNASVALTWGFGDLMTVVCGEYCDGIYSTIVSSCYPRVCLQCRCDSDCDLYGDCCPYPEGRFGQLDTRVSRRIPFYDPQNVWGRTRASATTDLTTIPVTESGPVGDSGDAVTGKWLRPQRRRRKKVRVPWGPEQSVSEQNQGPTSSPMDSPSGLEVEWFTDKKTTMFDCVVNKPGMYTVSYNDEGVFMLRKCRPDFDDPNVKRLCENDVRLHTPMPVSSLVSHYTFYNQFCAICNKETNLSYWQRKSFNGGQLLIVPNDVIPRKCDRRQSSEVDVTACNVTGLWQEYDADLLARCHLMYYPVSYMGRIFRNYYCLMCNGAELNCANEGRPGSSGRAFSIEIAEGSIPMLVNFMPSRERSEYTPRSKCGQRPDCEEGFWLDPFREMCRKLLCNAGRELVNGTCDLISPESQSMKYRATLLLAPKFSTTLANLVHLIEQNYGYISAGFRSENMKMVISEVKPIISENKYIMDACFLVNGGEIEDVEVQLMKFVNSEWKFPFGGVNQTILSTIVGSQEWLTNSISLPLSLAAIPGSRRFFPVSSNLELIDFKQVTVVVVKDFVNLTQHMVCPHVHIYSYGTNNTGMVQVLYEDVVFDVTRVTLEDHYLVVCVDILEALFNETHQDPLADEVTMEAKIRAGLSFFCTILSLLCLFFTICTYCAFSALRSQPGWNNLMLAVTLFSAQLTLLFFSLSSGSSSGCRIYGVVLHFVWLAAVMWMNVCSFHMFRTFTSLRMATDSVSLRRLAKYAVYAFGVPSAIVLITIATSMALSGGSEIGYGGRVCYLSTHILVGVAFALPLLLVLVSNLVFFVVTVRAIAATKKLHRDVENERANVYIYVKLCSLTGLFWIVALLAEVTAVQCLELLSVILNSSQGVFIFFSFVFKKKVFHLRRSRVVRKHRSSSTSSSYYTNSQPTHSSKV